MCSPDDGVCFDCARTVALLEFGGSAVKFVGMGILTNMSIDNEHRKNHMLYADGMADAIARCLAKGDVQLKARTCSLITSLGYAPFTVPPPF